MTAANQPITQVSQKHSASGRASSLKRVISRPTLVIGLAVIVAWILVAVFAPWISPYDPASIDYAALASPWPSAAHWLGVDSGGRDILSRIIYGSRVVLMVAPLSVLCAYCVGCTMGMIAGYYGGWIDTILSRIGDIILAFPTLVLYILLITTLGPSAVNIVLAVTVSASPGIARLARGQVLSLRKNDYVAAAQMRGESLFHILFIEILPNAKGPLLLDACVRIGWTTIAIGSLGFLGLGIPPPTPDWGGMIKDGAAVMLVWPHMALFPSIALVSLVLSINMVADAAGKKSR